MELKRYQAETMAVLRRFLEEARIAGPAAAYDAIVRTPEQAARLGRYAGAYRPLNGMPEVPYVCLRLPTGGGKTILGAHAVGLARDAWIEKDYPLVLWMVPSNTIRLQTADALKNPRHPYRQALDAAFAGRVRVFDIGDFAHIRPQDIRDHCCIVVGTIQTLRVSNTEGRRVYADHEEMEPHFSALPRSLPGLETRPDGRAKYSFANLLHIHRPLMIVDEAHNAVTGLSREMQARVNPCAILEFTATPRMNSNILHSVTAQELKQAEMIKLPIRLVEQDSWQAAVNGAVAARQSLQNAAATDADYIRPIVLFQAQPKNQEVTVEVLKRHLTEVEQISEAKIAVATGDQRELDGVNLFDPACPVEYVITMEALKEGWDCSFAYIFCSVARIQSAVDVEQLLGRVLRMPYATRRKAPELNRAYAFLSEPSFGAAARALADKLVAMGFDEDEAADSIEQVQFDLDAEGSLFGAQTRPRPVFRHSLPETPETAALADAAPEGVAVTRTPDGTVEIAVTGRVDAALEQRLIQAVPPAARTQFAEAVARYRAETRDALSPAERGDTFRAPRLMAEVQGELAFAEADLFLEAVDWSLLDHPAVLTEKEFTIRESGRSFEIDLNGNHVDYTSAGTAEQLSLDVEVEGWTPEALVLWLDKQLRHPEIHQGELLRWLRDLVAYLTGPRGLHVAALMRAKFLLARLLRDRIAAIRQQAQEGAYQRFLFAPEARVEVSFDQPFAFRDGMYRDQKRYRGRWRPGKHFLGPEGVPAFDGASGGEEQQCAEALDSLPQVKHWIRNVARHPQSFFLPTATGKFYPDFVAELTDGRIFVVEYKGALLADHDDTSEKRTVGLLWERQSAGRGLFLIVEKTAGDADMRAQMLAKIGG